MTLNVNFDAVLTQPLLRVPPLSEPLLRLIELTRADNAEIGAMYDIIAHDPVLASLTLKAANNNIVRGRVAITDLRHAIARLGLAGVRVNVTTRAYQEFLNQLPSAGLPGDIRRDYRKYQDYLIEMSTEAITSNPRLVQRSPSLLDLPLAMLFHPLPLLVALVYYAETLISEEHYVSTVRALYEHPNVLSVLASRVSKQLGLPCEIAAPDEGSVLAKAKAVIAESAIPFDSFLTSPIPVDVNGDTTASIAQHLLSL